MLTWAPGSQVFVRGARISRNGPGKALRLCLPDDHYDISRSRACVSPRLLPLALAPLRETRRRVSSPCCRPLKLIVIPATLLDLVLQRREAQHCQHDNVVRCSNGGVADRGQCRFRDCRDSHADRPRLPASPLTHSVVQVWDVTHGRLCVSGVHNKMAPKMPTPTPQKSRL